MPSTSFTFRCPQCNRLLGVSRSRVGSTVNCPRCATALVVPEPSDGAAVPSDAAPTPSPSVPPPPSASESAPEVPAPSPAEALPAAPAEIAAEPVFAALVLDPEPLSIRPSDSVRSTRASDRARAGASSSSSSPSTTSSSGTNSTETPTLAESPAARLPAPRRGDVILPRAAVLVGSFAFLVALILAFAAGLLAGHFVWTTPAHNAAPAAPPTPAAGKPA